MPLTVGRLRVSGLHGARWWQGVSVEWRCRPQPGDSLWMQRWRFIRIEVQW